MVKQCGKINVLLSEDFLGEWRPPSHHTGALPGDYARLLATPPCLAVLPHPDIIYLMAIKIFLCPRKISDHDKLLFC